MLFSSKKKLFLSAAITTLFGSQLAIADATLHFKSGTGPNKETHNMILIKDQRINLSQAAANSKQNYSIFDAKGEKIIHVNPEKKAYMVMDKALINEQVEKMKKSIKMMRAQMEERLKTMPVKQQDMMRKMMETQGLGPDSTPPKPTKKHINTGQNDTIAGIQCAIVEVQTNNVKTEELCVTKETQLGLDDNDAQAVIGMKKFMTYMAQSARRAMPNQAIEEEFEGLPLRTRSYDPKGTLVNEIVLDSISKNAISADKITIPNGYKLTETPQMH